MAGGLTLSNRERNKTQSSDLAVHSWYQFVLGYPPHLVRYYLKKFGISKNNTILDPFCGTGTSLVEASKNGISSYGIEANPMAFFASKVKTNRCHNLRTLENYHGYISRSIKLSYEHHGISEYTLNLFDYATSLKPIVMEHVKDIPAAEQNIIPTGFISPKPLLKVQIIRGIIDTINDPDARDFFRLALASFIVKDAGNIAFGPEIYRTKPKHDLNSQQRFLAIAANMIDDVKKTELKAESTPILGDARRVSEVLLADLKDKVNCVITSPPYPNEKDYTRSTRLESVLLGFVKQKKDLKAIKENLLRSNSRNIFTNDTDAMHIAKFSNITSLAGKIEQRRVQLEKTSGFERLYHKIVLHYFGGMYRHLRELKPYLASGAQLAYVVGDQASYFRILIPTAELLAEIAEDLGYKVKEIEVWRTRLATATRKQLNENVLILESP